MLKRNMSCRCRFAMVGNFVNGYDLTGGKKWKDLEMEWDLQFAIWRKNVFYLVVKTF